MTRRWAAALVWLAACSSNPGVPQTTPTPTPTPQLVATPTPTPTPPPRGSVTLAFAGDVHFEGALGRRLAADPASAIAAAAPLLVGADVAVVNLETAITTRGTREKKQYVFRAPPSAFDALRAAGVDVATMANNHGIDFGAVGLRDTLAAIRTSRFPVIGIGANADAAFAPWRTTVNGTRVAVLGASHVIDSALVARWSAGPRQAGIASAYDEARLVAAVRAARRSSDVVAVYLHWGVERESCPTRSQRRMARLVADAGADIVVGSHAHLLLGAGRLGRAVVSYGLGNFAFSSGRGVTAQTGVLTVTVAPTGAMSYAWAPAVIRNGVPQPLAGPAAARAVADWRRLRTCTDLTP